MHFAPATNGKYWVLDIPDVDGATQVKSLADAREYAVDYIHMLTDVPEAGIAVDVRITLANGLEKDVAEARKAVTRVAEFQAEAARRMREVTAGLQSAGLSQSEIAIVLVCRRDASRSCAGSRQRPADSRPRGPFTQLTHYARACQVAVRRASGSP